jgi:hypothetical protein
MERGGGGGYKDGGVGKGGERRGFKCGEVRKGSDIRDGK